MSLFKKVLDIRKIKKLKGIWFLGKDNNLIIYYSVKHKELLW